MREKTNYKHEFRILSRSFRYMHGRFTVYFISSILALGKLGIAFLIPYLYEQLIEAIKGGVDFGQILRIMALPFAALLLLAPLVCYGSYRQKCCANFATQNMQLDVFRHAVHMPISSLETDRTDKTMRATANVNKASSIFTGYTMTILFKFLIYFTGSLIILLWIDPILSLVGVGLSGITVFLETLFVSHLRTLEKEALSADAAQATVMADLLKNLHVTKLFCLEERLGRHYHSEGEKAYTCRLRYKIVRGMADGVLDFISFGAQATAILLEIFVFDSGRDFASVLYVAGIFSLMLSGVRELGNVLLFIQSTVANSERVYELLDSPVEPDRESTASPMTSESFYDVSTAPSEILSFKEIDFGYQPSKPVLKDFNLRLQPNRLVAIVGESGCGKTTLLKLIEHFYVPAHGQILLGNVPLEQLSNQDIRDCFSYIPQEAQLFDGSIIDNVSFFAEDPDLEKIAFCLNQADVNLDPSTQVGENGSKISGGQAQRISIARALYKNSPIYLMDEPTSSLDSETEDHFRKLMESLSKEKTVLCIAHRLSTIKNADLIAYMEDGQVKELGTHEELMQKGEGYQQLYLSMQA